MDPRRWPVAILLGRAIALELVQAIERYVEAVSSLVLDHGDFHGGCADRDRLDPPIDPDAVIEMDDVVALDQRAGRGRGCGLPVAAGAPEPPGAPEYFVVGKDSKPGHQESAIERAHHQRRMSRRPAAFLEQLVEPLDLALVVAENDRVGRAGEQVAQAIHLSIDLFRRQEAELQCCVLRHQPQLGRGGEAGLHLLRRLEDFIALGDVLAQPPRDLEMVRRLAPGALDLVGDRARRVEQQQRVGGQQVQQRTAPGRSRRIRTSGGRGHLGTRAPHRQNGDLVQLGSRPLRRQVEGAER